MQTSSGKAIRRASGPNVTHTPHWCAYDAELKNKKSHPETEQIREIYTMAKKEEEEGVNLSRNIYIYLFILRIHIHDRS